jgi:dUTP pyrophosphatase
MNIKVKKLHPDAQVPNIAHEGDAGCDLYTVDTIIVEPQQRVQVPVGLAFEIPHGYVGLIWDKSGVSHKGGIKTLGGVLDSGYRGELKVGLINLSSEAYVFEKGHKVAQMLIQKVESPIFEEVVELSDTSRGEGGFGSTGK